MTLKRRMFCLICILLVDIALLGIMIWLLPDRPHEILTGTDRIYMEPKYVALTFDDGPNEDFTGRLLDGLKERGIKVSFFLLGESLDGNEELVLRMSREGHLIGVHGMKHLDLTRERVEEAVRQLQETKNEIKNLTGKEAEYVRPPYGIWNESLNEAVLETLQMRSVLWDVDSLDWKLQNVGKIVKKVIGDVENGDIILMHDEFAESVDAAFRIIDNLIAKGYTFVTVDELMID